MGNRLPGVRPRQKQQASSGTVDRVTTVTGIRPGHGDIGLSSCTALTTPKTTSTRTRIRNAVNNRLTKRRRSLRNQVRFKRNAKDAVPIATGGVIGTK